MEENCARKWHLESQKDFSKCAVFDIKQQEFSHPDGRKGSFYVSKTRDWVQVLALTKDEKIILVKQYRFGVQDFSIEPAGGVMDEGEDPIVAGVRELREETGYVGKDPIIIGKVSSNPAILDNYSHFVLVRDCEKVCEIDLDENEDVEYMLCTMQELDKLVLEGRVHHSISLASLYFLKEYLNGRI